MNWFPTFLLRVLPSHIATSFFYQPNFTSKIIYLLILPHNASWNAVRLRPQPLSPLLTLLLPFSHSQHCHQQSYNFTKFRLCTSFAAKKCSPPHPPLDPYKIYAMCLFYKFLYLDLTAYLTLDWHIFWCILFKVYTFTLRVTYTFVRNLKHSVTFCSS